MYIREKRKLKMMIKGRINKNSSMKINDDQEWENKKKSSRLMKKGVIQAKNVTLN